jgi:hypothetical protein
MATFLERHALQYGHTLLRQRTQIAIEQGAYDVSNEDAGTANHANRLLWSQTALNNPTKMMDLEMALLVQNPTIAGAGDDSTDSDIQFVVNGLIDVYGNALAAGTIVITP